MSPDKRCPVCFGTVYTDGECCSVRCAEYWAYWTDPDTETAKFTRAEAEESPWNTAR